MSINKDLHLTYVTEPCQKSSSLLCPQRRTANVHVVLQCGAGEGRGRRVDDCDPLIVASSRALFNAVIVSLFMFF